MQLVKWEKSVPPPAEDLQQDTQVQTTLRGAICGKMFETDKWLKVTHSRSHSTLSHQE